MGVCRILNFFFIDLVSSASSSSGIFQNFISDTPRDFKKKR
jgi:hypothetical protein